MSRLEIRVLAPADLGALSALTLESEGEGFRFLARIPREIAANAHYLDSPHTVVLGVYADDVLIAVGGLTPDPYVDDPAVGRIRHVYVSFAHRRTGIGRRLLAALEARARNRYALLRLRTDTIAAAAFYESLSYVPVQSDSATHCRTVPGVADTIAPD